MLEVQSDSKSTPKFEDLGKTLKQWELLECLEIALN